MKINLFDLPNTQIYCNLTYGQATRKHYCLFFIINLQLILVNEFKGITLLLKVDSIKTILSSRQKSL
jgi:hypothetical protein